jgi:hypothetical protein
MDDATAGPRIKQLRHELEQLRAHHADLTDAAAHQPEPPTAGTLDALQTYLTRIAAAGTSGERKRAIEALVHEVRITEHGMIPVFKIPSSGGVPALPDDATAMTTVRTSGSRNGAVGGLDDAECEIRRCGGQPAANAAGQATKAELTAVPLPSPALVATGCATRAGRRSPRLPRSVCPPRS